jgi:hypothetical protein
MSAEWEQHRGSIEAGWKGILAGLDKVLAGSGV